jgi:hypothetical protein
MLLARIISKSIKDMLAALRRRSRSMEWPHANTATTIW